MEPVVVHLNGNEIGNIVYAREDGDKTLELDVGALLQAGQNILRIQIWAGDQTLLGLGRDVYGGSLLVTSQSATLIDKTYRTGERNKLFDENFTLQHD